MSPCVNCVAHFWCPVSASIAISASVRSLVNGGAAAGRGEKFRQIFVRTLNQTHGVFPRNGGGMRD